MPGPKKNFYEESSKRSELTVLIHDPIVVIDKLVKNNPAAAHERVEKYENFLPAKTKDEDIRLVFHPILY